MFLSLRDAQRTRNNFMLIKRKPLSRRTFLRGAGVSIALPFLEIMAPTESYAEDNTYTGFVYVPNGWYRQSNEFFPQQGGRQYTMTDLLRPLAAHRDDFMVISNLNNEGGRSQGDGGGDHARAGGSYLSSVRLLKDTARARGGQTIDRHISNVTRNSTPMDMLLMGYGPGDRSAGDSGYNAQNFRLSWRNQTDTVAWDSAQTVFQRLVSSQNEDSAEIDAVRRRELRLSVLDFVISDDLPRLNNQLGVADKEKLDSYLTGLRDAERRLDSGATMSQSCDIIDGANANGNMTEQIHLMFDLMINAFQCDLTRVAVVGLAIELNGLKPNGLNLANGWHNTSHYSGNTAKQQDYKEIGTWVSQRANALMNKLDNANLTQNSLISFGAGSGGDNSQSHGDDNLPTLLMGHGGGSVTTGRHLKLNNATPIANLWSAMAYHAGAPVNNNNWGQFGTGRLDLT